MNGDVIPLKREHFDLDALMAPQVPEVKKPKPHMVTCYVCHGWIIKGTLGPKGCPHCGGAL